MSEPPWLYKNALARRDHNRTWCSYCKLRHSCGCPVLRRPPCTPSLQQTATMKRRPATRMVRTCCGTSPYMYVHCRQLVCGVLHSLAVLRSSHDAAHAHQSRSPHHPTWPTPVVCTGAAIDAVNTGDPADIESVSRWAPSRALAVICSFPSVPMHATQNRWVPHQTVYPTATLLVTWAHSTP